jgi:precorrin-6A/cobalt-precorrin-6A reductase
MIRRDRSAPRAAGGGVSRPVLLLAGTEEAAELAVRLHGAGVGVVASFAGRTGAPAALPCPVRIGGFGGVDGLVAELRRGGYAGLVDATHPFAAAMPHHAAAAAVATAVPRVRVLRPPWVPGPGDHWDEVADLAAAAGRLDEVGARRVLLTVGRYDLAAFAPGGDRVYVVRSIEAPDPSVLPGAAVTVIAARPPFDLAAEAATLAVHRIDTLVAKNSGAAATAAKLDAAREAGVRVIMVRRPPAPAGPVVPTVEDALSALAGHGLIPAGA